MGVRKAQAAWPEAWPEARSNAQLLEPPDWTSVPKQSCFSGLLGLKGDSPW